VSPSFVIRPYLAADRARLIAVIDQVCAGSHFMATRRFEPTPAWDHALRQPACPCHLLLVAAFGPQVIGWCRLFPAASSADGPTADLGIGVAAPDRGRGVGSALLRAALRWARSQGLSAITLTTHPDNEGAIRFFRRHGFTILPAAGANALPMRWIAQPLPDLIPVAHRSPGGEEVIGLSLLHAS